MDEATPRGAMTEANPQRRRSPRLGSAQKSREKMAQTPAAVKRSITVRKIAPRKTGAPPEHDKENTPGGSGDGQGKRPRVSRPDPDRRTSSRSQDPDPDPRASSRRTSSRSQDPDPDRRASSRSQDPDPDPRASSRRTSSWSQQPDPDPRASSRSQDPDPDPDPRASSRRTSSRSQDPDPDPRASSRRTSSRSQQPDPDRRASSRSQDPDRRASSRIASSRSQDPEPEDALWSQKVRRSYSRLSDNPPDPRDTLFGFEKLKTPEVVRRGERSGSGSGLNSFTSLLEAEDCFPKPGPEPNTPELDPNIPGVVVVKERRRRRRKVEQIDSSELEVLAARMNAEFEEAEEFQLVVE